MLYDEEYKTWLAFRASAPASDVAAGEARGLQGLWARHTNNVNVLQKINQP